MLVHEKDKSVNISSFGDGDPPHKMIHHGVLEFVITENASVGPRAHMEVDKVHARIPRFCELGGNGILLSRS